MHITLEVIAASVADAVAAEAGGADRLELLSDLTGGGVTPSYGLIRAVRRAVRVPVFVMIRARPGSFLYSPAEVELMAEDARIARELGADGIVTGALTADGAIDTESVARIIETARLPATFHRAFEQVPDSLAALDLLGRLAGVERVLTSGGGRPLESAGALRALIAAAGPLEIMVGGGVTLENAAQIVRETGARAIHSGTAVREPQAVAGQVSARRVRMLREMLEGAK